MLTNVIKWHRQCRTQFLIDRLRRALAMSTPVKRTARLVVIEEPELHAIRNESSLGEAYRPEITRRELGECRLTVELKNIHYGKFNGVEAALVIIEVNFQSGGRIRYQSATIRIGFDRQSRGENP